MPTSLLLLTLLGQLRDFQNPEEVVHLVNGLSSNARTISLTYEGILRFVGPDTLGYSGGIHRYQGRFYLREDGATRTDVYTRGVEIDDYLTRTVRTLRDGRLEERVVIPDASRRARTPTLTSQGNPFALDEPGSPYRIVLLWYFRWLPSISPKVVEIKGWEMVDDRRCLKLSVNLSPDDGNRSSFRRTFWLDLERGGHPLKMEIWEKGRLKGRSRAQLGEVMTATDEPLWLPVSGTFESFLWESDYHDTPIFEESYKIVRDSVVINEPMSDQLFSADWEESRSVPSLAPVRREFETATRRTSPQRSRRDPASVQQDLDRRLAEAERQSAMVEASSATRSSPGWLSSLQIGLICVGLGTLCLIVILMRRGR